MKTIFVTIAMLAALVSSQTIESEPEVCGCFRCPSEMLAAPTVPRGPIICQIMNPIPLIGDLWTCTYDRGNGGLISKTGDGNVDICPETAPCTVGCNE